MDTVEPDLPGTSSTVVGRARLQLFPSDLALPSAVRPAQVPDDEPVLRTYRSIAERFVARQERYQLETQRVLEDLGDMPLD